jgi:hypothetical protein
MKYVSIEGSSYAGKTSVINQLEQMGYETIPEYDAFGPFLPNDGTLGSTQDVAKDLIERERKRTALLEKTSGDIVFGDRSVLSLITFEDMISYLKSGIVGTENESRDHIIGLLDDEIKKGSIIFPNAMIVMRVDSEDAFKERVNSRGATAVEALSSFAVQQLISERALFYGVRTLGPQSVTSIDTSWKNPHDVADAALNKAMEIPPSTQPVNINDLL